MISQFVMSYTRLALLLILVGFSGTPLAAQTVVGKYAGEFLALGVGGRALGMGGVSAALANDVTAGYWNPAGLSQINYPQLAFMHSQNFGGAVGYDYFGAAMPFQENKSFGISVIRLGVSDIANTTRAWDNVRNTFTDSARLFGVDAFINKFNSADYAVMLSYAVRTNYQLSYGINAKLIYRHIGDLASAKGIGFDVGLRYQTKNRLLLGASVQDITSTFLSWSGGNGYETSRNELITPTAKLGGGYVFDLLYGQFTFGLDTDMRFEGRRSASQLSVGNISMDFRGGIEYAYKGVLALRGGLDDIGRLTLGAGLKLSKLNIDYAFANFSGQDQLGNSHRISLQIELEQSELKRKGYEPEPPAQNEQPIRNEQ
jgi:hypothetical protein